MKEGGAMGTNVLTNRYENSRIGATGDETILNVENVSVTTFGKLFSRTVDGDLYAQPLIVSDLFIGGMKRDVVYLATSRNWVYAYDAEHPDEVLPFWSRNLGAPVPRDDIYPGYLNFACEIGITSTPVIELDGKGGGTLYVVAKTRTFSDGTKTIRQEIFALDILTGHNRRRHGKSAPITASVFNASGTIIAIDPRLNLNRAGLLLLKGALYLAFGSHGDYHDDDNSQFYGWIMAYDAKTLAQRAVYNTAPDWGEGGIWQSGTGLAGDADGFVYAVVGNGASEEFNEKRKMKRPDRVTAPVYGNAILKLKIFRQKDRTTFRVADWFTASNTFELNNDDADFIGGPVLLEAAPADGSSGHLILGGGKDGFFYLADREKLGGWMPAPDGNGNTVILQADKLCAFHIHGAPVIWKKSDTEIIAYVWSEKDFLKAFAFKGKKFDGSKPLSTSVYGLPQDELRMPGGILSLSSNGTQDGSGIVWASHPTDDDGMNKTVKGTLRAYDARDLNNELWNSDMDAAGTDRIGSFAKFCPPVVANGKVYMATFSRELVVYGLFSDIGKPPRSDDIGIFKLRTIGGVEVQQSATYGCSRYNLRITGQGIGDKKDHFLFAYANRDSLIDSEISICARVDGINAEQYPNARVGVMIRKYEQTDPSEHRFAAMIITNEKKALFLHRDFEGDSVEQDGPINVTLPCFIRLKARKDLVRPELIEFIGEFSLDGTNWTPVNAATKIQIDGRLDVGLAVTAQTGSVVDTSLSQAHAFFSKVVVTPGLSDVTDN
jgi:hypothetical protein